MTARVSIDTSEVDRLMSNMTRAERRGVMSGAIKWAARPMREAVKKGVPRVSGNTRKSVGFEIPKNPRRPMQDIVFLKYRTRGRWRGYLGAIIELGTKNRSVLGKGKYSSGNRGRIKGKQPMQRGTQITEDIYFQRLKLRVPQLISKKFAKI